MSNGRVTVERLQKVPLAALLTADQIKEFLPKVRVLSLRRGSSLPDQGMPLKVLYYVEDGHLSGTEVDPTGHRARQRAISAGEYLGHYALVTGMPCQLMATAEKDSTLLSIPLDELQPLLLPRIEQVPVAKGDILFAQGEPSDLLYFIRQGRISETRTSGAGEEGAEHTRTVRHAAGPGEYVGRYSLLTGQPYRATATAQEDTELLSIPLRDLQPLLFAHTNWRDWFLQTDVAERLRAVPLFKDFDDWDIYLVADEVQSENRTEGDVVYRGNEEAESFYVIDRGQVVVRTTAGGAPWYLAAGNYFGRDSLEEGRRKGTAVVRKPARLFAISGPAFQKMLQHRGIDLADDLGRNDLLDQVKAVPLFAELSEEHLRLLLGYVSLVLYRPGDIIARQGEPADSLMILDEGEAVVLRRTGRERARPVRHLKVHPGDPKNSIRSRSQESEYFGAHSLLEDEMRGATVEVTQLSTWIVLERSDFKQFLADAGLRKADLGLGSQPDVHARTTPPVDRLPLPFKTRRHWIIPVTRILPAAILVLLVGIWILVTLGRGVDSGLEGALLVFQMAILVILLGAVAWLFAEWWNDVFLVTNRAVVHIERQLFFSEERYEAPLRQIQNVNASVSALGQVLGYGNLNIETAAAQGQVQFTIVPDAGYVQELIQRAADEAKSGRQSEFRESIRQRLEDQLNPERLRPKVPESVLRQERQEGQAEEPERTKLLTVVRSLAWYPKFEIRRDGRITWRKHWLRLIIRAGLPLLAFLVTSWLLFVLAVAGLTRLVGFPPLVLPPISAVGTRAWLVLPILILWTLSALWLKYQYEEWSNDIYIVTDEEVIDQERKLAVFPFWGIYTESRRRASLSNVQYVDLRIPHPLALLLNYGDVLVRTAGAEGTLDFVFVHNPRHVYAEILRRLNEFQERQRQRQFEERSAEMAQWFETYQDVSRRNNSMQE
jgi:CRP-like cAMP-binding protein/membrane protein YdbS with pleckstrin-like domain